VGPRVIAIGAATVVAVGLLAGFLIVRRGLSARDEPSAVETVVARSLRHLAVPSNDRNLPNPVKLTPEVLAEARQHFADHCAMCHGNNGSGETMVGQNLYPKAPDLRLPPTQQLSDGELYYIIQNGVRLTGMPAWGDEDNDHAEASWHLVHLIRHLHELTPAQLKEMKTLNPKTPDEIEEERRDEEFLRGGAAPAAPEAAKPPAAAHGHKH
jgi:mono/diheme cytochrome c family protein